MRLKKSASVLFFISSYAPISIILLLQNFDWETFNLEYSAIVYISLVLSLISLVVFNIGIRGLKFSSTPVDIVSLFKHKKRFQINGYWYPYLILFILNGLSSPLYLILFGIYMGVLYIILRDSHALFINPISKLFGYRIDKVKYTVHDRNYKAYFIYTGVRLKKKESLRVIELSKNLFLVVQRNPNV